MHSHNRNSNFAGETIELLFFSILTESRQRDNLNYFELD